MKTTTEQVPGSDVEVRPARPDEIERLRAIDDDAATLYAEHGIAIVLDSDHVFSRTELERWQRAAELQQVFLALDAAGNDLGFAALELACGEPYLDQLSVRRAAMRRGLGTRLLSRSIAWAREGGGTVLWLTTYRHLPFNLPYYERHGFVTVPDDSCSPGIRAHLEEQRHFLPKPTERVAMRLAL